MTLSRAHATTPHQAVVEHTDRACGRGVWLTAGASWAIDVFAIGLCLAATAAVFLLTRSSESAAVISPGATVAAWLGAAMLAYACGLGDPGVNSSRRETTLRAVVVGLLAGGVAVAVEFPGPEAAKWPAAATLAGLVAATLVGWRSLAWRRRDGAGLRAVVVGTPLACRRLTRLLGGSGVGPYEILGFVSPSPAVPRLVAGDQTACLGVLDDLAAVCDRASVRLVVLASEVEACPRWLTTLAELRSRGVQCRSAESLSMSVAHRVPADLIGGRWLVERLERVDHPYRRRGKRVGDVLLGVTGLVLFGAMFPLLWVAVRLDSAGPFLYSQPRVGLGGRPFRLYKIRTMRAATSEERWAAHGDTRITRVGAVLRKLRIDEFPQFWNVLRGDMSLVGPRPEQPGLVEALEKRIPLFGIRHLVKPGITGWAQIHYGYASSVEGSRVKLAYDLYYVHHYSLLLDLDIMLKTFFVMLLGFRAR